MFGISASGGQNWTFVDSPGTKDKTMLTTLFGPAAAEKVQVPESKRRVLYREP